MQYWQLLRLQLLTADHFLEDLFARVDGHVVHLLVPLGPYELQLPVVPEGSPLGVDDHVLLPREVGLVQGF